MADDRKKIMVGYNAYFTSDEVIRVAKEHTRAFDAKLYVVSSVVGHSLNQAGVLANEEAQRRLAQFESSLQE